MRIAIGPFSTSPADLWPVYDHQSLAPEFDVVPFHSLAPVMVDEPIIVWSPEYAQSIGRQVVREHRGFRVAVVGDHHINDPDVSGYDLVFGDLAYARKHPGAVYFRQFSYDPRLHHAYPPVERDIDVAFMGRSTPGRQALIRRVHDWAAPMRRVRLQLDPFPRGTEAEVYRRAKVVLGHSQRGELQMRAYEAMACGALYVAQHAVQDEAIRARCPLPTYDPNHIEEFLEHWLADENALQSVVAAQREWVKTERPVDHLRWLCRQIKERLNGKSAALAGEERGRPQVVVAAGGNPGLGVSLQGVSLKEKDDELLGKSAARPVGAPSRRPGADDTATKLAGVHDHSVDFVGGDRSASGGAPGSAASSPEPPLNEQRLECVALVPPSARTILDVGCGDGGFGWALKQRNLNAVVVGIDARPINHPGGLPRLDVFERQEIESDDWRGAWTNEPFVGYDCITLLDVLEHLLRPAVVLARLRPLLKEDGCVVASIPNVANLPLIWDLLTGRGFPYHTPGRTLFEGPPSNIRCSQHLRFFAKWDISAMFGRAGYEIVHWETTGMVAPSLARIHDDVAYLLATHGHDPEQFKQSAYVAQYLVVARPSWAASADPASLLPT